MKKLLSVLLCVMLLLSAFPAFALGATATVLVYMCGSDLESVDGSGTADIKEMMKAAGENVNIVIETGGAKKWHTSGISNKACQIHEVTPSGIKTVKEIGKRNMADAATLSEFVSYGYANYAADNMLLVIWDHGAGPSDGVCFDELYDDDSLLLPEMQTALKGGIPSGKRLSAIIFDACLMATAETVAAFDGYVDYVVASEETVPGTGLDYGSWISAYASDTAMSIESLGKVICDGIIADAESQRGESATMALIKVSEAAAVVSALSTFGDSVIEKADASFSAVSRARGSISSFGEYIGEDASDLVDIQELCDAFSALCPNECAALSAAAENAVVYSAATSDLSGVAGGLSVFFPYSTIDYAEYFLESYSELEYMGAYASIVTDITERLECGGYSFAAYTPSNVLTASSSGVSGTLSQSGLWAGLTSQPQQGGESGGSLWGGLVGSSQGQEQSQGSLWAGLLSTEHSGDGQQGASASLWAGLVQSGEDYYSGGDENPNVTGSAEAVDVALEAASYFQDSNLSVQALYAIQLNKDELDNLLKASGALILSEKDGYTQLGTFGKTTVDWTNGMVYSMFDGRWPMLGGQMISLTEIARASGVAKAVIPVSVGGKDMYLLASIRESGEMSVLGLTEGYSAETGAAMRGYTEICEGMEIVPRFNRITVLSDGTEEESTVYGKPITVTAGGLELAFGTLSGAYRYGFLLTDIFGGRQYTDFVDLSF
ncbi:MAG: clostripain-related cysteine peptidase [Eubacteriales bacterium]|nr:clostripain-related cysteine peptidase [Eubacteriales bacterium]MDD4513464.1 clostripain-related cysteine peptidase [Eubacteriales bacterium]